jgi:hypothetical protein
MRLQQSFITILVLGLLIMSPNFAQDGPRIKGHTVAISGENPFISLALEAGGKVLTNVSFWRVIYSPAGVGHACYIRSDVTGNGPSSDDIRAVYTDNVKLVEYLNKEIMSVFDKSYADKPYTVYEGTFQKKGDTLTEYREVVTSGKTKVELVWRDFYLPILIEIPVKPFTITTTLIPAKVAEVYVNSVKAVGCVFPRPEGTAQGSTGTLAFSETWVK